MKERLKVTTEPVKLRFTSEPYAMFVTKQYVPVIDVHELKRQRDYYLIISPVSLSMKLNDIRLESGGALIHSEIWLHKESDEKYAKYVVELA
mgnify:CR=1 FL=1